MNEWEALRQECLNCHACTLADTRQNVVFGVGRHVYRRSPRRQRGYAG